VRKQVDMAAILGGVLNTLLSLFTYPYCHLKENAYAVHGLMVGSYYTNLMVILSSLTTIVVAPFVGFIDGYRVISETNQAEKMLAAFVAPAIVIDDHMQKVSKTDFLKNRLNAISAEFEAVRINIDDSNIAASQYLPGSHKRPKKERTNSKFRQQKNNFS